jgi:16S rRNA (cytidine1402-2'-O)-methyltransferase
MNKDDIKSFTKEKFPELNVEKGVLYVVSTPIGNLEDISYRALFILENVDLIACEDTRVTGNLLSHYGIRTRMISYYSNVEENKLDFLINELKSGKSVALVSDAGTPCISDPGSILVSKCIQEGIDVFSIPGASSLINALVLSGSPTGKFYFQGFLPQKKGREKTFLELRNIHQTIIIFEAKYRIKKMLNECKKYFGNKEVAVCRELSKKFEEVTSGYLKDLNPDSIKEKGEFVVVINNN